MELLDFYNEKNEKKGVLERNLVHKNNLWHREITVWILNEKNEILLQRRSALKKVGANKLSLLAGHVMAGEKEIDAALRELEEEVGLKVEENNLIFLDIYINKQINNNCFSYTYLLKTNKRIEDMVIQIEEVSELKYISIPELEDRLNRMDKEINFIGKPLIRYALDKIKENYLN